MAANANDTRIRVRLTPTEHRRLQRRRDRYAVRLVCRKLKLGRGSAE